MVSIIPPPFEPGTAVSVLQTAPHTFLQPTPQIHYSFLQLAKHYLDPLAHDIGSNQDLRQLQLREDRKKRKRRRGDEAPLAKLKIRKIFIDGFEADQVWQQARQVLESAGDEVETALVDTEVAHEEAKSNGNPKKTVRFDDAELDDQEEEDGFDPGDEDNGDGYNESDDEDEEWEYDGKDAANRNRLDLEDDSNASVEDAASDDDSDDEQPRREQSRALVKDKFGLNDGFFSIDDFNKQTQFLEQADERGEDDGAASDEEEVDWSVDPSTMNMQSSQTTKRDQRPNGKSSNGANEESDDEESEDADGPTFGNVDLNAPEGDSDVDDFEMEDGGGMDAGGEFSNTNEITYTDFFAPPAALKSKKKAKQKPPRSRIQKPDDISPHKNDPVQENVEVDGDVDLERTISAVQRDLFDEESDISGSDAEREPGRVSAYTANKNLSSHEKRQLALREEIRKLEAANVSAKPWSLMGETLAPERPVNSLLEEDLDFETSGKPVPVVTDSVNEDIEALIKRRILSRQFDEVVRRRPDDLITGPQRRGRLEEISDVRSKKGLAEEYEEDYLRKTDANFVDSRSEALKAKHADIESHWKAISSQLDALCNLHYKPRPPEVNVDVRTDLPRIAMEDARPAAAGDGVEESMLAPQEIYKTGDAGRIDGEVMTKGGLSVGRDEQTREQKKRRRMREKERAKKASISSNGKAPGTNGIKGANKVASSQRVKSDVVGQLKRGGVKVIGKKGELRDVEGKEVHERAGQKMNGGNFKL